MAKKTRAQRLYEQNQRRQEQRANTAVESSTASTPARTSATRQSIARLGTAALAATGIVGVKGVSRAARVADASAYPITSLIGRLLTRRGGLFGSNPTPRPTTRAAAQIFNQHQGIENLIRSSLVHYLYYHEAAQVVQTRLNGRNYYYTGVPIHIFWTWQAGAAACLTNDHSSLHRWRIGKTPSLGAYFNQHIKGRYPSHRGIYRP